MSFGSGKVWDFGTRLGVVFIVEAACFSALAVTATLLYIGYNTVKVSRGTSHRWTIATHIHYYFLNLMVFDLIQAIGGMMSIRWIADAAVTQGSFCTTQGALKQVGNVGVALTSLTIALHTFCVLVFQWKSQPAIALLIIGFIWVFITLVIGITFATHRGKMYYGDTHYWCWITSHYPSERIALEYLWMWIAAFVDVVVYIFLALVVTGFVAVSSGKIRLNTGQKRIRRTLTSSRGDIRERDATTIAIGLLFYPAVYIITILPITVARFITFCNPTANVPFAATVFADMLFALSGFLNVILFTHTRPNLLPPRERSMPMVSESPTTSFNVRKTKGHMFDSEYRLNGVHDWMAPGIGIPGKSYLSRHESRSLAILDIK